jgi:hypothetical protein
MGTIGIEGNVLAVEGAPKSIQVSRKWHDKPPRHHRHQRAAAVLRATRQTVM